MKLYPNWKYIVTHAWSVLFMILAGVLTTAEILLPLYVQEIPRGVFAVLTLIAVTGGLISRLVVQKGLE